MSNTVAYTKIFNMQQCSDKPRHGTWPGLTLSRCAYFCKNKYSTCEIFSYDTSSKECRTYFANECKADASLRTMSASTTIYQLGDHVSAPAPDGVNVGDLMDQISVLQKQLTISEQQDKMHQLALGGQDAEIKELENQLRIAKLKKELADLGSMIILL